MKESRFDKVNEHIKKYDVTHISVYPSGNIGQRWDCYLAGVKVGEIAYRSKYKHYVASTCVFENDCWNWSHIGAYKTLYDARIAMLDVARTLMPTRKLRQTNIPPVFFPSCDTQFYPTPRNIAGKLMEGIDWSQITSILEPSAGRGDLVEWVEKRIANGYVRGMSGRYCLENKDIDCIEIDPNLRALLVGKGMRVVHDNFLTYHTNKWYDLIIMNPPFADGDAHLLHAIDLCRHGGQIACILNAETIRNPYTNRRKVLLSELSKYGATIRYLGNGFKSSARKTDVEVALINMSIPKAVADTSIWDELEKANEAHIKTDCANEMAPANPMERLIQEYDLLCKSGISMIQIYNGVAPRIHDSSKSKYSRPIIELCINGDTCDTLCSSNDVNKFLRAARARYWQELLELPELQERMTSTMREKYGNMVSQMADYEFSAFNIQQTIEKILGQLQTGVEDAIMKCFDKLSAKHTYNNDIQNDNIHYYNGWKTNEAHRVNVKCIIPTYGCFARGYKVDKYGHWKDTLEGLDVRGCFQVLDDLEKALDYLDKGETLPTNLESTLRAAEAEGRTTVYCKYFTVTFYKKGTCHIKFHNEKILERLNIFVGRQRNWLPPTYGKVRYDDMDDNSRAIVDEFQGRDEYEKICSDVENYLIDVKPTPLMLA